MSAAEHRPHDATPSRRRRAVHEGNVARSAELTGMASFAAAALAVAAVLPFAAPAAAAALSSAARDAGADPRAFALLGSCALAPPAAGAFGALAAGFAQSGGPRFVAPKLQLSRLSPGAGLRRMFGGEALIGAARALSAFLVAAAAMWPPAHRMFALAAGTHAVSAYGAAAAEAAFRALLTALAAGVAFAALDYMLARRRWLRGIKMSHEELKRDQKENDGDPQARARRTQAHRALVRGSVQRTRDASFVVVNPSHIAVALRYAPPRVPVPEILVRAADDAALAVKTLAARHGVPVVENVPLARALFAQGEAGRAIPRDTFVAVAYVIAALAREGALA